MTNRIPSATAIRRQSQEARPAAMVPRAVPTSPTPSPDAWLVGDIGGTNARFALCTAQDRNLRHVRSLDSHRHTDLVGLIRTYCEQTDCPIPNTACIAVAGPITGDRCRTTNAELDFSIAETARQLSIERLLVINDLAAAALATTTLAEGDTMPIGTPRPVASLTTATIGLGTGLGLAAHVPQTAGPPIIVDGEGGHALLPVIDELESAISQAARARGLTLTAETVVSGPGITRLRQLLSEVHAVRTDPLPPDQICARALNACDQLCAETLELFCGFLGTVASSVALTTGARGGVYLIGGILPKIAEFLIRSRFRTRFETNPVMSAYLADIATSLVTDPYPGLRGAAIRLHMPYGPLPGDG